MEFHLREVCAEDEPFLYELYASTREDEVRAWGWSPQQAEVFLRMQFQAQNSSYQHMYRGAKHHIVESEGIAAGRVLVYRDKAEVRLVDIAVLPKFRNRGLGEAVIRRVMEEVSRGTLPLRLQVLQTSPAQRLYHRLGFRISATDPLYIAMEWIPNKSVEEGQ